jgi:hypothetical protein
MSREKIKVPNDVYEELTALQREIHFTLDIQDTIKRSEDRGYMKAANWIRQNENAYNVGFSWGFEADTSEPTPMVRDIPEREAPSPRRTISHPPPIERSRPQPQQPRPQRRSSSSSDNGIFAGIRNWLKKYF